MIKIQSDVGDEADKFGCCPILKCLKIIVIRRAAFGLTD